MKKYIIILTGFLLLLGENALALTGDEILKKMEVSVNAPKDRTLIQRMVLIKKDGSRKERKIKIYQKGTKKRLFVFLAPAGVKGVGFLSLSDEKMYLYMPAFRKIRRIASHIKNENFMGTDFSYEDLAEAEYTKNYTARLEKEENGQYLIESTPRPGVKVSYSKQRILVDKKSFVPKRIEYYGKDGTLEKILLGEDIKQVGGYWLAGKMTMQNVNNKHQTVLEILEIQHDTKLKDKMFSKRNLKRLGR